MTERAETATEPSANGHVPALDGMRGIAVLLVLLFHLRVPGFRAGFIGVDLFFVLSGFLITSLLLEEIRRTGRVSVPAFWARRARRLLPALVLVLLVVGIVTWATATYTERASLRGDLLATTGYVANWHLISTSTYFADIGVDSPLEHTWSLGIEEQFYFVWPLLVFAVAAVAIRPRRGVALIALLGATISAVALALLWSSGSPERAYMGTDARIFEPLLGAAGATFVASPGGRARLKRSGWWIAAAGAAVLLVGLAAIPPGDRVYALGGAVLVSAGALAIIAPVWVGAAGAASAALSWRPLAWIGVISYGVYLWHWPIVIWLGVREPGATHLLLRQILAASLTFGVATLSFYAAEKPIRNGTLIAGLRARVRPRPLGATLRRRTVVTLAAVPVTLLGVAGVSLAMTGVPPISTEDRVVMVVGDSVPARLSASLERAFAGEGWRFVNAAFGGCPPSGETPAKPDGTPWGVLPGCHAGVPRLQDAFLRTASPDLILWWDRFSISGFRGEGGRVVTAGSPEFWALRREALDATVRRLGAGGAIVVLIATEPPGVSFLDRCDDVGCDWPTFQAEHYGHVTTPWNELLRGYVTEHPETTRFISLTDVVCRDDVAPCDDHIEGVSARPDGIHYVGIGKEAVIRAILDRLGHLLDRSEPLEG